MNTADIIVAVLLAWGGIMGFKKGFFLELAALAGLVAGIYLGIIGADIAGRVLSGLVNWNPLPVKIIAFLVVFAVVSMLFHLLGSLLTQFLKAIMLNFINRLAGLALGVVKMAFLTALVFLFINLFHQEYGLFSIEWLEGSFFYRTLQDLIPALFQWERLQDVGEMIRV